MLITVQRGLGNPVSGFEGGCDRSQLTKMVDYTLSHYCMYREIGISSIVSNSPKERQKTRESECGEKEYEAYERYGMHALDRVDTARSSTLIQDETRVLRVREVANSAIIKWLCPLRLRPRWTKALPCPCPALCPATLLVYFAALFSPRVLRK